MPIIERAKQRRDVIVTKLAEQLYNDPSSTDVLLTAEVKAILTDENKRREQNSIKSLNEQKDEIIEALKKRLSENVDEVDKVFAKDNMEASGLRKKANDVKDRNAKVSLQRKELNKAKTDLDAAQKAGDKIREAMQKRVEKIKEHQKDLEDLLKSQNDINRKWVRVIGTKERSDDAQINKINRESAINKKAIKTLIILIGCWDKKTDPCIRRVLVKTDGLLEGDKHFGKDISSALKNYKEKKKAYEKAGADVKKAEEILSASKNAYEKEVGDLLDQKGYTFLDDPKTYLTLSVRREFGLPLSSSVEPVTESELVELLNAYFADDENYMKIIGIFMYSDTPTVIDGIFNAARLRVCRQYKTIDPEEVKAFIVKIAEALAEYEKISDLEIK